MTNNHINGDPIRFALALAITESGNVAIQPQGQTTADEFALVMAKVIAKVLPGLMARDEKQAAAQGIEVPTKEMLDRAVGGSNRLKGFLGDD